MISPEDWPPLRCLSRPAAIGASFHVAAAQAMTQRGLADGVAQWFGLEAMPDFVDWPEPGRRAGAGHDQTTRQHTFRSITASIAQGRDTLGHAPRYSSLDALREALAWLAAHGQAGIGGQPFTSWGMRRAQCPACR